MLDLVLKETNLIKILSSFTCSPLLTCHGVGDLKKPHYVSDPMSYPLY